MGRRLILKALEWRGNSCQNKNWDKSIQHIYMKIKNLMTNFVIILEMRPFTFLHNKGNYNKATLQLHI